MLRVPDKNSIATLQYVQIMTFSLIKCLLCFVNRLINKHEKKQEKLVFGNNVSWALVFPK